MGELVPYIPGMQQGQGYNTFLQELCVKNAVTVEASNHPGNPFRREYRSELVENYEKLAKSLKISAGAAVSGWGQSGQVNVSLLDRSEGSVSDKHSFNKIDTDKPMKTYGDRYVADFIRGGHFFARVSITAKNSSQTQELKQSAEMAFSMYRAEGKVTQEVENAVTKINKNSSVNITIHESTGVSNNAAATFAQTETTDLLAVKAKADEFFADASSGQHNYMLYAVLAKYTNLSNFGNSFIPLDYAEASNRSWTLFDDFTKYQALVKLIKAVPASKFKGGSSQSELSNKTIDECLKLRNRVLLISEQPDVARQEPNHTAPDAFQLEVLRAIKTKTYIAQSRPTRGDDNWTDIAATTKDSDATELLRFEAFDFGDVIGTEVVSFGKSTSRGEDYVSLIGERANTIDGWKEESYFWVFPGLVDNFAPQTLAVARIASKNYLRVYAADQTDIDRPRKYQMFYFFVPQAAKSG